MIKISLSPRLTRAVTAGLIGFVLLGCSSPQEKAAKYIKDGKELFEQGNLVQANLQFRNALQIDDKLGDAWLYLAKIDLHDQKWDQAYRDLNRVIQADPGNKEALAQLGGLQVAANQLDDALKTSDALLKVAPNEAATHTLRGAVMFRLQNTDMAYDEAQEALRLEPGNVDATLLLARVDQSKGDSDAAIAAIADGLTKNPGNVPLQLVKIDILESQSKPDAVVDAFQELIKQNPKERSFRNLLATHFLRHGQQDKAADVLEQTAKDFPDQADAKLAVIRFAEQTSGRGRAIELARGYAGQSSSSDIKFELARLLIADGQKAEGKRIYLDFAGSDDDPTVIKAQTELARLAIDDGNADDAMERISSVLQLDARNGDALMLRAVLAMQQEKPGDAITYLNTVLTDSPNSGRALMLLGQAYFLRGEIELGKEQYYRAIEANPNDPNIPITFANVLSQRQEYGQAESILDRFLARSPNNVAALQAMAQIRLNRQDWLGAQQIAERLRSLQGGGTVSQQIEGSVLQAQEKLGASNEVFQQLYAQNPNLQQPIVALVQNYIRAGRKDEAKSFLDQVIKTNPKNVTAQMLLGSVYESEGAKDKADTAFQTAIDANDSASGARLRYAQVLVLRGDHEGALKVLQDGLTKDQDDVVLMLGVALVYQYVSDYDNAIAEYENILKRQPRVDIAANNLSSLLTDYRTDAASHERALSLALRFRDSNIPFFLDTLGWAYYKLGRIDEGMTWMKKAVDEAPNSAILRYHLALAQLKAGDKASAKKNLETVVGSDDSSFSEMADAKRTLQSL
jgi:predicted Zn-dependent protease